MIKSSFFLLSILLINYFKPIESSNSIPNLNKSTKLIPELSSSKSIKKRSPKLNNFFEDDKPFNDNTDYIDFSGVYKDEIDQTKQTQVSNRKRGLDDKSKEKRRKRKRRKHHKPSRFKRKDKEERIKDNLDNLKRVSLKPSILNKFNLNNDEIKEQKHIISLLSEDHLHHLIIDERNSSLDNKVKDSNASKLKQPIKSALKFNQTDRNEELNKILDKIVNEKTDRPTNTKTTNQIDDNLNNGLNDENKKSNYIGNFHLQIRTPKDLNINELQNFTLITSTDLNREKELRLKLEQLKVSIDKLTNKMKISLDDKQDKVLDNDHTSHSNMNNNTSVDNNRKKLKNKQKDKIYGRMNRIKSKLNNLEKINDKFQSKHLVCFKRPPLMSTFCYMVN